MAGQVSRRLSNSFEGALAGGGDPATSPLYVFGPFLKLIVVAGVAQVTFGATIWMVVLTVVMVSAMYRQVMIWVTDGSGGSGLSEEEFGGWAVKINGGITVIEYTLTFLVSMAALVTFVADRLPVLNEAVFGIQFRTFVAIALTVFTGWLVNRGPKVAARTFGPATAAVLVLLWAMIITTIITRGFDLPDFNLMAFSSETVTFAGEHGQETSSYFNLTLGGYARILALMTGIEIFANLVAAYDGKRAERSRKAFGSLIIIMGTTCLTMLIVGPAIYELSNPCIPALAPGVVQLPCEEPITVSVFTQTMDALLPVWASYAGTLIGVAVLLSASAAAAQGIQNLALGLRYRHYIAASLGQRNKYDVADRPVWLMVAAIAVLFLIFGTSEETYLALYAAGVFILLSMTGWAASKRLMRQVRESFTPLKLAAIVGTILAAILTSVATFIIFEERFFEGAWIYFLLVPGLYVVFTYYRNRLGKPPSVEERLGSIMTEQKYFPRALQNTSSEEAEFKKLVVPLNGSALAEQSIAIARTFARAYDAQIKFISVEDKESGEGGRNQLDEYLQMVTGLITDDELTADYSIKKGEAGEEITRFAGQNNADLIVMTTRGKFEVGAIMSKSVSQRVLSRTSTPTLLIRPTDADWRTRRSRFKRILVALDGSEAAETVLPYIRSFANRFDSKVLLLSVPEGSESEDYRDKIQTYLDDIASVLIDEGYSIKTLVTGSGPARTILDISVEERVDLIMMASHGRGGVERLEQISIGSVAERIVNKTPCPLFIVPLRGKAGSISTTENTDDTEKDEN